MRRNTVSLAVVGMTLIIVAACSVSVLSNKPAPGSVATEPQTGSRDVSVANFHQSTEIQPAEVPAAASHAVDLIGAWVDAGAPRTAPFDYQG